MVTLLCMAMLHKAEETLPHVGLRNCHHHSSSEVCPNPLPLLCQHQLCEMVLLMTRRRKKSEPNGHLSDRQSDQPNGWVSGGCACQPWVGGDHWCGSRSGLQSGRPSSDLRWSNQPVCQVWPLPRPLLPLHLLTLGMSHQRCHAPRLCHALPQRPPLP